MNRTERIVILSLCALLFVLIGIRYYQDQARRVDVQVIRGGEAR